MDIEKWLDMFILKETPLYYHHMDNHTLAITVSAGAIGATLAYLGYNNFLQRDEETENPEQQNTEIHKTRRSDIHTPTNKIVSSMSPVNKKESVEETSTQAKQAVKSEWGQFWKGEYESQRSQQNSPQEVKADDYN